MKAVLRGKLIALKASVKKLEHSHINELTEQQKSLKQKEVTSPRMSSLQEIIKLKVKTNGIETKKTTKRINETISWFVKKINRTNIP